MSAALLLLPQSRVCRCCSTCSSFRDPNAIAVPVDLVARSHCVVSVSKRGAVKGHASSGCSSGRIAVDAAPRRRAAHRGPRAPSVRAAMQQQEGDGAPPQQQPVAPYILGLTGSIGMGKSAVSAMLAARGVPVIDADAIVHALYSRGGAAVAPIAAAFPSAIVDGAVSRPDLSRAVVGDGSAMARLEAIVHPLVEAERAARVRAAAEAGALLVVLDVPLLFETGGESACDGVAVVSAPPEAQRARVLARPGMAPEKFEAILARQIPDAEKRARADYVIDTGCSLEETAAAVGALVDALLARGGGGPDGAYSRAAAGAAAAAGGAQPKAGDGGGGD